MVITVIVKNMKKKQKIILAVLLLTIIVVVTGYIFVNIKSDSCNATDNLHSNCIPAGRCTPLGDQRESTTDCQLKNYDHKAK